MNCVEQNNKTLLVVAPKLDRTYKKKWNQQQAIEETVDGKEVKNRQYSERLQAGGLVFTGKQS